MDTISSTNSAFDSSGGRGLLPPGTMVAHYRIIENIGSGGMGDVYLADDTKLARRVALKFLSSLIASDPSLRARFTREVQAVASLNHPNVVHVYEVSEFNKLPYCAMEYVEGRSLRDLIRENILDFSEIVRLAVEIASGLEAAHNLGIVHRDVKPANIILDRGGRVRILDFGLAKRASDPDLTIVGSTLGTVNYMSPEQAQGKESDRRSDIFSYGIVLYQLIARKLPFKGAFDAATLTSIVHDDPPALRDHRPDTPQGFQRIVSRLLEKNAEKRYQSMADVITDLEQLEADIRSGRADVRPPRSTARKAAIWGGVAVIILINGVVAYNLLHSLPAARKDQPQEDVRANDHAQAAQTIETHATDASPEFGQPEPAIARADTVLVVDSAQTLAVRLAEERAQSLTDSLSRMREALIRDGQPAAAEDPDNQTDAEPSHTRSLADQFASVNAATADNSESKDKPGESSEPSSAARSHVADSTKIVSRILEFWRGLESGEMTVMHEAYPAMSSATAKNWEMFCKNTTDRTVNSDIRELRLDDDRAHGLVMVRMSFRDGRGSHNQNLLYEMRLRDADGRWDITAVDVRQ